MTLEDKKNENNDDNERLVTIRKSENGVFNKKFLSSTYIHESSQDSLSHIQNAIDI
jgi:hypothetical protein